MNNPLLAMQYLPAFSSIRVEHTVPAIEQMICITQQGITSLLNNKTVFTWHTLCQPLMSMEERLSRVWSPIRHLHNVNNDPKWRTSYQTCLQLLSQHHTWLGQHYKLFLAYQKVRNDPKFDQLTKAQQQAILNKLRDFKLSAVHLDTNKKSQYGDIINRLSLLSTRFENNVLDATTQWYKLITDEQLLAGVPQDILLIARQDAKSCGQQGWRLSLARHIYQAILTYCDNRNLRYEIYYAYNTRACDLGLHAGQWDNSAIMDEIINLRYKMSQLLGFNNYVEYSLATKMAKSPTEVLNFLTELAQKIHSQGKQDVKELQNFAKIFGISELQPWDIAYYSEKLKQQKYTINEELLRPYFPATHVINGLFELVNKLFSINIRERNDVDVWHPDVRFFDLYKNDRQIIGSFYLDIYTRPTKHDGAWMDECVNACCDEKGKWQNPVAYLICNFTPPIDSNPALLNHDEVITLFHEFGHCLHHLLTKVEVSTVSGTNVLWDVVEVPSQFLENWCWQKAVLSTISKHYQTKKPLPQSMIEQMLAAKNFHASLSILRQIELALFDFNIHYDCTNNKKIDILKKFNEVKHAVGVLPTSNWLRTPHTFSHIFAGSYAAGYYSYLWAEIISADAFSRFEEDGLFNKQTGQDFIDTMLSQGAAEDPLVLFKKFRGREPLSKAFLHYNGIQ